MRVRRPGGELKIMLYNRRAILALNTRVKNALAKGKPWKSLAWYLCNHVECTGDKVYTKTEVVNVLEGLCIGRIAIQKEVTSHDTLAAQSLPPLNAFFRLLIHLAGVTYSRREKFYKKGAGSMITTSGEYSAGGSALGFFDCIHGIKN